MVDGAQGGAGLLGSLARTSKRRVSLCAIRTTSGPSRDEAHRLSGLGDDQIDHVVAALEKRLQHLDEQAFANPDNWRAAIFEQLRDGLL